MFKTCIKYPELVWTLISVIIWYFIRNSFGASWDTALHIQYGDATKEYFKSFDFNIIKALPSDNIYLYNATTDYLVSVISSLVTTPVHVLRNNITGLFWVACFFPVVKIAKSSNLLAGWLSGLLLLLIPPFLCHGFINPKDTPLVTAACWFFYGISSKPWSALGYGVSLGAVLAARPGAIFLAPLLLFPLFREYTNHTKYKILLKYLFIGALAWASMVAIWPFAHQNPIVNPLKAIFFNLNFSHAIPVKYAGQIYLSTELPWHYLLGYLLATLPIATTLLAIIGQYSLIKSKHWALLTCFWLPMSLFFVITPNIYSGLRHFLFLYPLMAIYAAIGASALIHACKYKYAVGSSLVLILLLPLKDIIQLHPYQYVYYNELIPKEQLEDDFETDYWLISFREAAEFLNGVASSEDKIIVSAGNYALGTTSFSLFYKYPHNVIAAPPDIFFSQDRQLPEGVSYYVGCNALHGYYSFYGKAAIIYKISRNKIPIAIIRSNKVNEETTPDKVRVP